MILGHAIFSELQIELCLSDNTIRLKEGIHKGCMAPIKDVSKIISTHHSIVLKAKDFGMKKYARENMC